MRDFLRTIIRGYGWRLGALAAVATAALVKSFV